MSHPRYVQMIEPDLRCTIRSRHKEMMNKRQSVQYLFNVCDHH